MGQTVLSIYNAAISAAGGRGRLSALTAPSKEREECDTWYELIRDVAQEAAYWPAVKTSARLSLVAERATGAWTINQPQNPYAYAYDLPNNYLRAWHLHDYAPFELTFNVDSNRVRLHTDSEQAILTYGRINTNPAQWGASLQHAVIMALSAHIIPGISGKAQLAQQRLQQANDALMAAQASAANDQQPMLESMPPTLAARGGAITPSQTRYIYPNGALFSPSAGVNP